jgi:hypothetical protein
VDIVGDGSDVVFAKAQDWKSLSGGHIEDSRTEGLL